MGTYSSGVQVLTTENRKDLCIFMVSEKEDCGIVFYDRKTGQEIVRHPFPIKNRIGNVHYQSITDMDVHGVSYLLYEEDRLIADPYAVGFAEKDVFGQQKDVTAYKAVMDEEEYEWGSDTLPQIPYEECILYCMHVRGFTKHASSGVEAPGTFAGVAEKIPYLKDLGITTLELQPIYEFNELPVVYAKGCPLVRPLIPRLNYWGYTEGFYYTPKRGYAKSDNACREFKDMVKALHENGLEVVLQFYFPQTVSRLEIPGILRFWREKYHVDGFRLKGVGLPLKELVTDAWLADCKLLFDEMPVGMTGVKECEKPVRKWAVCREDYMWKVRRFLRGDAGSLRDAVMCMNFTSKSYGVINYITNYYGFTLADMVSYERKYNEANGEENRDGAEENFSCNYGVEGKTLEKQVLLRRWEQMKNAMTLLMLSQGTPLFFMGDEFANSQQGNNNPYCQDNEVTWLNWKDFETNGKWYETVRELIAFRKKHTIFPLPLQWLLSDYKECGYPDLSYHGSEAWLQNWEYAHRHVGMMFCGDYVEGNAGKYYYVAINMHVHEQSFALPTLPKDFEWNVIMGEESVMEDVERKNGSLKPVYVLESKKIVIFEGSKQSQEPKPCI